MRAKQLREKRLKLITEIRAIYAKEDDEKYVWSKEDGEAVARMEAELAATEEALARAEKDEQHSQRLADLGRNVRREQRDRIGREDFDHRDDDDDKDDEPTFRDRALALQAWFRSGTESELTRDQHAACRRLSFNPRQRGITLDIGEDGFISQLAEEVRENPINRGKHAMRRLCRERSEAEKRAGLSAFDGSTGGYLVPIDFLNRLEENMVAFGGMLQVAEIIRTDNGAEMIWPTVDDTSNTGEIVGERESLDGSTNPSIKQLKWYAHKFSSKMLKVSSELLDDNAFNLAGRIGGWLGERLGRIQNTYYTNGNGVKQPRGIITDAALGKTTASATAITFDEVFDLMASIDPAYTSNARFMCSRQIITYLRKLKDSQNRYLWEPSLQAGTPDIFCATPITLNTAMATAVTSGLKTLLYGDLSYYKVRQVKGLRLRRLDERYADTDEVAFVALLRADGGLLNAGTCPVKYMQQA